MTARMTSTAFLPLKYLGLGALLALFFVADVFVAPAAAEASEPAGGWTGHHSAQPTIDGVAADRDGMTADAVSIVVRVTLDNLKDGGWWWDPAGDMGDPYIVVNGAREPGGLSRCKDSQVCDFYVSPGAGSSLRIAVWDEDAVNDDFVGSCTCSVGQRCRCGASTVSVGAIRIP